MNITTRVPESSLLDYKYTKIIATVGPATDSYEKILELIRSGVNGIRLNFSHGNYEERARQIKWIRKASQEWGKPVALIQDLQGPKIRLGDFDGIFNIAKDQSFRLRFNADFSRENVLPTQYDLSKKVKRGERIYFYDGKVKTIVTSVKDGIVHVKAENEGFLISKKGINLPDTDFEGDILTKKDKEDIAYGSEHDIDYVALSFVQTASDVKELQRILKNLGSSAKIIAKIETKAAVGNLESIIDAADAVMVARGDLAIETTPEDVPIVQRKIVTIGLDKHKPTIIATQMLASMVDAPEPSRAEVSDVATAVYLGADAVMLSDETANGSYPIEAVKVMKTIITHVQENNAYNQFSVQPKVDVTRPEAISISIVQLADNLKAHAIVAETKSGATASKISSYRSGKPIIAVTSTNRVANQLSIVYAVKSFVRKDEQSQANKLADWLRKKNIFHKGNIVVIVSGQYPGIVGTTDTIKVRVLE